MSDVLDTSKVTEWAKVTVNSGGVSESKLIALLSCPFCGGRGVLNQLTICNWLVGCKKCNASVSAKYQTALGAVNAWNRRAN